MKIKENRKIWLKIIYVNIKHSIKDEKQGQFYETYQWQVKIYENTDKDGYLQNFKIVAIIIYFFIIMKQ